MSKFKLILKVLEFIIITEIQYEIMHIVEALVTSRQCIFTCFIQALLFTFARASLTKRELREKRKKVALKVPSESK